jgi:7-alpha-hydroxysteroid dehydrogenase
MTPAAQPHVDDIANLTVFLLSVAGSRITGQLTGVGGGHSPRCGPDLSALFEPLFGAEALRG